MGFFYHIFGIIYYIIWSLIGAALIVFFVFVVGLKPWTALSQMKDNPLQGLSQLQSSLSGAKSVANQAAAIGDIVNKLQSGQGLDSALPKATQDCLKKEIGEKQLADLIAGKTKPSPDLIFKAMNCVK